MAVAAVPFFMIVMYGVLIRICSGTIEISLLNVYWMKDDEGVSDEAKHSRHARQAIVARRRPVFLSITRMFHFRRLSLFMYGYVRRADEDLPGYNRRNRRVYVMHSG